MGLWRKMSYKILTYPKTWYHKDLTKVYILMDFEVMYVSSYGMIYLSKESYTMF